MKHAQQTGFSFAEFPLPAPGSVPAPVAAAHLLRAADLPAAAVELRELWAAVQLPATTTTAPHELELLAGRALEFTPRVSLVPPDALLLELRGSIRLFGGLGALFAALQSEFVAADSIALAPTPLAALALVRSGKSCCILDTARLASRLAALPLRSLRWPEEAIGRLVSMGVRTVGEALRLPRAGFARRFGPELLESLDRLMARRSDPRLAFRPPERFRVHCEPNFELTAQAAVMRSLMPLLAQLETFLQERQRGISALLLRLFHRDRPASRCLLRLARPESSAQQFAELLEAQLQQLVLPAPVRRCELHSGPLLDYTQYSDALWKPGEHGSGGAAAQMPAFLERLRARLGTQAVQGLCLLSEHRPERLGHPAEPLPQQGAVRHAQPGAGAVGAGAAAAGVMVPWAAGRRPLWLLPEPQRLAVVRDDADSRACPSYQGGRLTRVSGPERLETGWWDQAGIERDYYIALDTSGARLWIFREINSPRRWFLHGIFC